MTVNSEVACIPKIYLFNQAKCIAGEGGLGLLKNLKISFCKKIMCHVKCRIIHLDFSQCELFCAFNNMHVTYIQHGF